MAESTEPPHLNEPPEEFLLRHLSLIERIAASFARLRRLRSQEVKDFLSWVNLKLIEDDYRRIRAYRGSCPAKLFLAIVIGRLGKDYLDHLWGRWRPCAEARRLGPVAVLLDRLTNRDGRTLEEACEEILARHDIETSRDQLEAFYLAFPSRTLPPRETGDDILVETSSAEPSPEESSMAGETACRRAKLLACLKEAIGALPADDRLLLRLLTIEDISVANVARTHKLDQKSLYRRRDKILRSLREYLEQRGFGKDEIDSLF